MQQVASLGPNWISQCYAVSTLQRSTHVTSGGRVIDQIGSQEWQSQGNKRADRPGQLESTCVGSEMVLCSICRRELKCEKKNPRRNQSSFLPVFFKYKGLQLGPLQCQAIWLGCQPAVSRVLSNNKEFWKWQILGRKSSLYMQPLQCLHSRSYLLTFHIRIQYSWSLCEIFVLT